MIDLESITWEKFIDYVVFIISIVIIIFHRLSIEDYPILRYSEQTRSTWMPKTSKHPLVELDKELQETVMLEEMWRK